jgi:hypothetical protein
MLNKSQTADMRWSYSLVVERWPTTRHNKEDSYSPEWNNGHRTSESSLVCHNISNVSWKEIT